MSIFRKSQKSGYSPGSKTIGRTTIFKPVQVVTEDNPYPETRIEKKVVNVADYAQALGLPDSDDYRLEVMLRNGVAPEFVNVNGMLDSNDPLDTSNDGAGAVLFDRLQSIVEMHEATDEKPSVDVPPAEPATPSSSTE